MLFCYTLVFAVPLSWLQNDCHHDWLRQRYKICCIHCRNRVFGRLSETLSLFLQAEADALLETTSKEYDEAKMDNESIDWNEIDRILK